MLAALDLIGEAGESYDSWLEPFIGSGAKKLIEGELCSDLERKRALFSEFNAPPLDNSPYA